ncbi:hypothetical protein [Streptomyces sundarbansensis]
MTRSPSPAALRRRPLNLSVRLWWHPYRQTSFSVPAVRSALRRAVRTQRAERAA